MIIELKTNDFDQAINSNKVITLVTFTLPWCGVSKILMPVLNDIQKDFKSDMIVYNLDLNEYSHIATKFNVFKSPTLIFFSRGELKDLISGLISKKELKHKIELLLNKEL